MTGVTVQLRDLDSGQVIVAQKISSDAGSIKRRELAGRLCDKHSDPRDCYVVEMEPGDSGELEVLSKYQL